MEYPWTDLRADEEYDLSKGCKMEDVVSGWSLLNKIHSPDEKYSQVRLGPATAVTSSDSSKMCSIGVFSVASSVAVSISYDESTIIIQP